MAKKKHQPSLFDELEKENQPNQEKNQPSQKEVQIVKKDNKVLSKEQLRFNRLTKKIETLEKEIETTKINLEDLLTYYNAEFEPVNIAIARQKVRLAFLVEEKLLSTKFSKKTKTQCQFLITYLLDEAFQTIEPNKEETELYDRFNETSYEEEKSQQLDNLKEQMQAMFADIFDIDVDFSNLNMDDPEDLARFQKEISEKMREKQGNEEEPQPQKKKTKKQLEAELLEKAKQEAQNKSLKSVYLSLSKVLHPDTETDAVLKMEKEELMKRVTAAYKDKDFPTLLKLELEWVHKTSDKLNELSDEQLKIYNELLEDRAAELSNSKNMLYNDPRYMQVGRFVNVAFKRSKQQLKEIKKSREEYVENLKYNEKIFASLTDKNHLTPFIDDFYNEVYDKSMLNFLF